MANQADRLLRWQEKYTEAKREYSSVLDNMKDNEEAYFGTRKIKNPNGQDADKSNVSNVRKMVFELIETQVDVNIPMPRVISKKGREDRARMIEGMLRSEIDRLDTELFLDEQGRITPMLGASIFALEWDNSKRTHYSLGELNVKNIHPNQVIPEPGVYKLDEMDYVFVVYEQTKDYVKSVYGVDVENESSEKDAKYEHMVTHIFCYYKNDEGEIGLFSWIGDTVVQDYDSYFARLHKVCAKCSRPKVGEKCECGSRKFKDAKLKSEKVTLIDPNTKIPTEVEVEYYVPKIFPFVIRKNVALLNRFLGGSDTDAIKDQQNELNILTTKIREKTLKGGSYLTLPEDVEFKATDEELKIIRLTDPSQKAMIGVDTVQPNISNDLGILNLNYEIGRQTIGITDSFQGRQDNTATSGKAKEFAAARTAGRLQSKKVMKDYAFSKLYEYMFKFMLAFDDEPRPYVEETIDGKREYKNFDKTLFIDRDAEGVYYYDDDFVFSVDVAGTLANDRQAMWQETRSNFESGGYGDPTQLDTLKMYWTTMKKLHYPGSEDALVLIDQRIQEQQALATQQRREEVVANAIAQNNAEKLMQQNMILEQENKDIQNAQQNQKANEAAVDNILSQLGLGGE